MKYKKPMMKGRQEDDEMSQAEIHAKKNVLSALRDQASEMMGDKLKKVTVAADSNNDLKMGLEKAKDLIAKHGVEGSPEEEASESQEEAHAEGDDSAEEAQESPEMEHDEHDEAEEGEHEMKPAQEGSLHEHEGEDDLDAIDQKIQELMKRKKHLEMKK